MAPSWYKVDNVAKVFLATTSRRDPRVFRLSCTLTREVDPDLLNEALRRTAQEWPQFQVALGGEKWLDCGTASKRDGILGLCKALDIPPEAVLAFGDNYNDIPMLEAVGMPVAMAGGPEEVKSRFARRAACPEDFMEKTLGLGAEFVRK